VNPNSSNAVDAVTVLGWLERPESVTVLDVRGPAEFETVHIAGSHNVPLDLLGEHAAEVAARVDDRVVLVCQSGVRAEEARRRLAASGMTELHVLRGGIGSYEQAGGAVVRGRARWSIERQVRLVAGSLVLGGTLAGLRSRPLLTVSGGVGLGLIISALTNTCTMGRLLAALPYNRTAGQHGSAEELLTALEEAGTRARS
jgi:rhodanese-related sulfurtransferase